MKRLFICVFICLLLVGCTAAPAEQSPEDTQPEQLPETETTLPVELPGQGAEAVFGVWRNAGQYQEGREFVETMTLDETGACEIQLDYQGEPYQTLRGTYYVMGEWLYTTLYDDGEEIHRDFLFTRDGRELILESESKTVTYIKVDG